MAAWAICCDASRAGISDPQHRRSSGGIQQNQIADTRHLAEGVRDWDAHARVLRLCAPCRREQAHMDEKHPDSVPEWTIGRTPAGDILLSLVHAESPAEYLKGNAHETHLSLSPKQAQNLADELREAASKLAAHGPGSGQATDTPPLPQIVNLNAPSGASPRSDGKDGGRWKIPRITKGR